MSRERTAKATRVLVISRSAGSMNPGVEGRLREEFADHLVVDFDPGKDLEELLTERAKIVVAGGDGTVEFIVRRFADTTHPIGILPLGTYNNLAHALGIPDRLEEAISIARQGHPHAITIGRVNGKVFVEACAIGLFGETIALGDTAKKMGFGKLAPMLKNIFAARPFQYELSGDIDGSGSALSLVFSNTASIGSMLAVSDASPISPRLEFTVHAGRTRLDIVARWLKSFLHVLRLRPMDPAAQVFRFSRLEVTTKPRVHAYADNMLAGRTPATITAEASALKVLLPK